MYSSWYGETEEIGDSHIDFAEFIRFLKQKKYEGDLTVEATAFDKESGEVDTGMLNRCFSAIRGYLQDTESCYSER